MLKPRTIGAISLRPTGNAQGKRLFSGLNTGKVIAQNKWTALPMPTEDIERVNDLGKNMTLDLTEESGNLPGANFEMPLQQYTANDTNDNETNVITNLNEVREATLEIPEECNHDTNNQEISIEEYPQVENNLDDYKDITELKEGDLEEEMNAQYGVHHSKYDLRLRRMRGYSHLYTTLEHTCMTQYILKQGL
jgi:hypothetical protein